MCGIFGLVSLSSARMPRDAWEDALRLLFLESESRGKEAAGIAIATPAEIIVHKDSVSAGAMMRTAEYRQALDRGGAGFFTGNPDDAAYIAALGHARLVTNGLQGIDANNQPIWRDDVVIVHNGIVVNVDELWAEHANLAPRANVDTEVIAALIHERCVHGASTRDATRSVFAEIYGETSIAFFQARSEQMTLGTNSGSLYFCKAASGDALFFSSEERICQTLIRDGSFAAFRGALVVQVRAGEGLSISLRDLTLDRFPLAQDATPVAAPAVAPMLAAQRRIEDKTYRVELARRSMRRCTKCLLPETMPFINYDGAGVCNYCHSYKPWTRRPERELEEVLRRRRSRDGGHDCVMAFSGGRDSSMGLYLMKAKYGMNPLAFTYDWGMVTDLARRNQARICGALGIEHIWVSADIKRKRDNIRRNVLAWLKRPDIGLVPLFMAGDKQVMWHANRIMDESGISIMAFCTNRYEKTEFKTGFLGVSSFAATIHRPATLPLAEKAGMVWQYGKRFAANPAYLNRSIPDTISAFFSYYAIKQEYFSLFDYVEWDEKEIDRTLIDEFDWELAPDAASTWRIGDGTAPFYNYIYYSVAGFTESDTFRSNQIREGVISREEALRMVEVENQPRWRSIREYTQLINIDFDETIRVIDRIPKLYM